jgi:cellobiose epimerase
MKIRTKIFFVFLFSINSFLQIFSQLDENLAEKKLLAIFNEIQVAFNDEINLWYPLCIDTIYGGYYSDINYKWQLDGIQNKMIVSQARHIWSASNAYIFYNDRKDLLCTAEHGFKFIKDKMWDKTYGGFYDLVDRKGNPIKENGELIKRAYGNAFAIYGLACYYRASGNIEALNLAKKTFYWLDQHSFDKVNGGYFQFLSEEGEAFMDGYKITPPKDQNSSIHLLEAFTELYKVWKDDLLKQRLTEMMQLIRDKFTTENGFLNLFFTKELNPISFRDSLIEVRNKNLEFDHVSFGHDIETAYLLIEAEEVLGNPSLDKTLSVAKKMIDHTINCGWDNLNGGIYDAGYYFKENQPIQIIKNNKVWWAQAEALNTLFLASNLFIESREKYLIKFIKMWNFIKKYSLDQENKGWFWDALDNVPENKVYPKGTIWKVNYHTSRSLSNILHLKNQIK